MAGSTPPFHIVKDTERGDVVASGTLEEMKIVAKNLNEQYQSTAYRVEPWKSHKKENNAQEDR